MKHVLLATLTLIGLSAFAPRAEAGGFSRVYDRYDRCDRPVYSHGRSSHYAPTYYRSYRPEYYRSDYYTYRRPTYVRDTCYSSPRGYYSSRPRFSISIGF